MKFCRSMKSVLVASQPVLAKQCTTPFLGEGAASRWIAHLPRRNGRRLANTLYAGRGFAELLKLREETGVVFTKKTLMPGKVSPRLSVPSQIERPPYADTGRVPDYVDRPEVHDKEGIEKMRRAGKLAAQVLEYAGSMARPGVVTDAIDKAAHNFIIDHGAYPSPLNYKGFPKSLCTSINECVCHGIPDSRQLEDGDILNIDVTVYLDGYHGDTSRMFYIGDVKDDAKHLCEVTQQARDEAVSICGPGVPFKKIGRVISEIAAANGYQVVKGFVGHGVGKVFHAGPYVLHHRNSEPGKMRVGQTFTIEPILIAGTLNQHTWDDDWTVVDVNGALSAQFEHTILITQEGVEVLTTL